MDATFAVYASLILIGTFISAVSQVLLKKAAQKTYSSHIKEYLNARVIFAYTMFVVSTLLCILAYRVVPLSFGPVLESTSYIYVTIFGVIFFKETINSKKIFSLVLILIGIVIYSFGL